MNKYFKVLYVKEDMCDDVVVVGVITLLTLSVIRDIISRRQPRYSE